MVTSRGLVGIVGQCNELVRRVGNGSLEVSEVRRALQDIIEGKSLQSMLTQSPSWYTSPQAQIEQVSIFLEAYGSGLEGFASADIPPVPDFTPNSPNEVLLLTVTLPDMDSVVTGLQWTFEAWWDFIVPPKGFAKWRTDELKSDPQHLRLAPGTEHTPGISWVMFDSNAYRGKSTETALKQSKRDSVRLAGTEVLMAAALFPGWVASWDADASSCPNLSGLQFYWNTEWLSVPYLVRGHDTFQLELRSGRAEFVDSDWACPTVREC